MDEYTKYGTRVPEGYKINAQTGGIERADSPYAGMSQLQAIDAMSKAAQGGQQFSSPAPSQQVPQAGAQMGRVDPMQAFAMLRRNNPQANDQQIRAELYKMKEAGMFGSTGLSFDQRMQLMEQQQQNMMQRAGQNPELAGKIAGAKTEAEKAAELKTAEPLAAAKETGTKTAGAEVKLRENFTKAQSAMQGFKQQADTVTKNVSSALDIIGKYPQATGWGALLSSLPESKAGELSNALQTIKANVGFDKLQTMRENSPTGGALGQVSDFENKLLQAVNGALDPKYPEQLKQNLAVIQELYPRVLEEKQRAFDQDYGGTTPIGGAIVPPKAAAPAQSGGLPAGWSVQIGQ